MVRAGRGIDKVGSPVVTDCGRCGKGAVTVPAGRFQAEMGYTFEDTRGADTNHTIGELLMRIGMGRNAEYYGGYPVMKSPQTWHTGNGGLTILLSPDTQLDLRAGGGAVGTQPSFFGGVGFSWRR